MNKKTRIGERLTLWWVKYDTNIGLVSDKTGYQIHEEIRVEIVEEKEVRGSWGGGKAKGYKAREVGGHREWTCNWKFFDDASSMPMFYWTRDDDEYYVDAKQASNHWSPCFLPNGDRAPVPLGCKRCEKHNRVYDESDQCWECDLEATHSKIDFSAAKPPSVDDEKYLTQCSILWRPGDTVVIQNDDVRTHVNGKGYDVPQGMVGTIMHFAERYHGRADGGHDESGVYSDHNTVTIMLNPQDQTLIDAKISEVTLSSYQMALVDPAVLMGRAKEQAAEGNWPPKEAKIRDLPDTKFWEGDKVRLLNPQLWAKLPEPDLGFLKMVSQKPELKKICGDQIKPFVELYEKMLRLLVEGKERDSVISRIDYQSAQRKNPTIVGIYDVECPGGGGSYCYITEDKLELVERGNLWKYYHNEPLTFVDLKEEANFYHSIGKYENVRNPKHNLYKWTAEEMLDAIAKGIVHGFNISGNPFQPPVDEKQVYHNAVRFHDLELGKRIAQETLKTLKCTPAWCEWE